MRFFLFWGGGGGGGGEETLDRPLSNFDVIGIPTGAWSSSLFGCLEHVPSCVVGFSCPCVLWAQVVVRAQLPLLIGLKNSLECMRMNSGYGAFVDYFFFSIVLTGVLLVVLLLVTLPSIVVVLFALMLVVLLGSLLFLVSHSRTAFREKYSLPGVLPQGCGFWEMLWDALIVGACLPCALSQMARHVFQYPRMDTQLGLFLSDPSALPPLRPLDSDGSGGSGQRPRMADEAGLAWTDNRHLADFTPQTGRAHRQQAQEERQREQIRSEGAVPATAAAAVSRGTTPAMAHATVVP